MLQDLTFLISCLHWQPAILVDVHIKFNQPSRSNIFRSQVADHDSSMDGTKPHWATNSLVVLTLHCIPKLFAGQHDLLLAGKKQYQPYWERSVTRVKHKECIEIVFRGSSALSSRQPSSAFADTPGGPGP